MSKARKCTVVTLTKSQEQTHPGASDGYLQSMFYVSPEKIQELPLNPLLEGSASLARMLKVTASASVPFS